MPSNPAYASPGYTKTPITGPNIAANDSKAVRELWQKTVDMYEETNDFWADFEGSGPDAVIQTITDLSKGAGQTINFTSKSGFYAEPKFGNSRFNDSSDYEDMRTNTDSLRVGWFRHGSEIDEHTEEYLGLRGELSAGIPEMQGEWLGRTKSERIFMMLREKTAAENRLSIKSSLNFNTIILAGQTMKRWGGRPAMMGTGPNGQRVKKFLVVGVEDALTSLKLDSDYVERLKLGAERGLTNAIFNGGFTDVDGHVIRPYEAIEHDGYGAIGSPMNPMGRLAIAMRAPTAGNNANIITTTAGYTALSGGIGNNNVIVLGGSDYDANNKLIKPSKWFPNYAYQFSEYETKVAGTDPFWVAVVNPPDANGIKKFGLYECTTNDGVALQVTKVWVASGDAHATGTGAPVKVANFNISGYTNPAFNTNFHTTVHPVGSEVVLVDPDGVARFDSVILGAGAARRGYGKHRNKRAMETAEGDFVMRRWVKSVFGQELRKDRHDRARGVTLIRHRGQYSNMPLPTPTTPIPS